MAKFKRRPQRSLQTILVLWFVLFSVVPLAFVTGYSVIKYEKAIDNELSQRLRGNGREIEVILTDFRSGLEETRARYQRDPSIIYHLSVGDATALKAIASQWLRGDLASTLSFFNRDGRMLTSVFKDEKGDLKEFQPPGGASLFLSESNLERLRLVDQYSFVDFHNKRMSLILISKFLGPSNRRVGYAEQVIDLNEAFLKRLSDRMKLELILLRSNGQVVASSHPDFYAYKKDHFEKYIGSESPPFFDLTIREVPYGLIVQPLTWGTSSFYLVLGASKKEARAVLQNVNFAFYSVVGAVVVLLIVTILFISRTILRPLRELVDATDNIHASDRPIEMPIKSDTEIGLLTESFNEMSRNVVQARSDLRKKIQELEKAYSELKEAQAKLVHSSKMISLGQLVAGVAHELNNPVGFIYSNMGHLRDYAKRLLTLADIAEREPQRLAQAKVDLDIEYIRNDLPRLIASCEDGARRTKDIVLGLRNFSRLEEAQLKDIDFHEAIENTLQLLTGEIKNRIEVHRNFSKIPLVSCNASQINQVFMNILSNAVQAIEGPGSIWITTSLQKSPQGRDLVQVSFQDSGKGMSAQVMEKIFDPFFSTKGVGQGTGLGLSISYGIIQDHGGDIQVKSQVGTGTEFIITIPVRQG